MSAGTGFGAVRLGGEQGVMSMNVGDMCQWMGNGLRGGRVARKVCEPPSIIVSQGAWGHAYGGLDKRGWGWGSIWGIRQYIKVSGGGRLRGGQQEF